MSKKKQEQTNEVEDESPVIVVLDQSERIIHIENREIAAPQRLGVNTVKETVPVTLTSETVLTTD